MLKKKREVQKQARKKKSDMTKYDTILTGAIT